MEVKAKYIENIKKQTEKLKVLQRKGVILGNIRLMVAIATLVSVVLLIMYWLNLAFVSLLIITLGVFVYLSVIHSDISRDIRYAKGIIKVNNDYIKRITGEWKQFKANGKEYIDYNHNYTYDLDIFGEKSLFQLINITKTAFGRERLCNDLASPSYTRDEIENRQEAIAELASKDAITHDFEVYGSDIKYNKDLEKVITYVKDKPIFLKKDWLKYILRPLPIVIIILCCLLLSVGTTGCRIAAAALMIIQVLIFGIFSPKTLIYLAASEKIHYSLADYSRLYELIESQEFDSKTLKRIKYDITSSEFSAAKANKQLERILQRIQVRTSGIMYLVLNILFLWDIGCAFSLSAWTAKYGDHIERWYRSLGEFESLASFSVLGGVLDNKCMAKATDKKHILDATKIGHPLLNNDVRVCNSFKLVRNINIVSGSNMSGKTTFLRTLGINLLLAKNGGYVCAENMTFSNMDICSSMRIHDDLMDGISTFYSELKKIKRILEMAEKSDDLLFLIDEIFRGTNSADRTAGAKAVIRKLKEKNAYGLLTTHDLKLCEEADGIDISNYNFSEHYESFSANSSNSSSMGKTSDSTNNCRGTLSFNYKINNGIAQTTNGEYLMKLIGIM